MNRIIIFTPHNGVGNIPLPILQQAHSVFSIGNAGYQVIKSRGFAVDTLLTKEQVEKYLDFLQERDAPHEVADTIP